MRPFRILGIQQIAIGGEDKSKLARFWVEILGLACVKTFVSQAENVDEDVLRIGEGPRAVEVDIMQPLDMNRKPRVDQPSLNHIGLWVDNLPGAVEWLTEQGVRFTPGGIRPGASGYDICFIHPKGNEEFPLSGEGVLIELVQAPPEVIRVLG
jgi:lactoylglutathione lyase